MSKTNLINSNDSKGSIGIFILYNSVNMHLYIYLLHLLIVSKKHAMFLSVPSKRTCFFLFSLGNFYDTVYFHIRCMLFYIISSQRRCSGKSRVLKSYFKLLEKPLRWVIISYYITSNYILYQANAIISYTTYAFIS